jgi:uncharacterized repeat protein (TIGR03803 family)
MLFLRGVVFVCSLAWAILPAAGQTNFTVLRSFNNLPTSGAVPIAGVIRASDGWLYGTTPTGGSNNPAAGTVFKLQTNGSGFAVIWNFSGVDGSALNAPVIEASDGNLYGTAYSGGISNAGTVFRVSKNGSNFAVLHHFLGGNDSANLSSGLIEGSDGYLYGMTSFGNTTTRGTIFKVDKNGNNYAILHAFTGNPDGQQPNGRLTRGTDGALYGTTPFGGTTVRGTAFKINEDGSGYVILRNFIAGATGTSPGAAGLVEASDNLLYGATASAGTGGSGTLYKMDKSGGGYTVILSFSNSVNSFCSPREVIEASDGSLYGASQLGGPSGKGGIFKVNKDGTGYAVLRYFSGNSGDGDSPYMTLCLGGSNIFYGTTQYGGQSGGGCVFELSATPVRPWALALSMSGSSSVIQFNGTASAQYVIERSINLASWTNLVSVTPPGHGTTRFTNDSPPQPGAVYRVRLQ